MGGGAANSICSVLLAMLAWLVWDGGGATRLRMIWRPRLPLPRVQCAPMGSRWMEMMSVCTKQHSMQE